MNIWGGICDMIHEFIDSLTPELRARIDIKTLARLEAELRATVAIDPTSLAKVGEIAQILSNPKIGIDAQTQNFAIEALGKIDKTIRDMKLTVGLDSATLGGLDKLSIQIANALQNIKGELIIRGDPKTLDKLEKVFKNSVVYVTNLFLIWKKPYASEFNPSLVILTFDKEKEEFVATTKFIKLKGVNFLKQLPKAVGVVRVVKVVDGKEETEMILDLSKDYSCIADDEASIKLEGKLFKESDVIKGDIKIVVTWEAGRSQSIPISVENAIKEKSQMIQEMEKQIAGLKNDVADLRNRDNDRKALQDSLNQKLN